MFHFEENTRAYIRFAIEPPESVTSEADITMFRNSFKMRAINRDTRKEFNSVRFEPMTQTFLANKHGYTIMVESYSDRPIPKARWGLIILSKPSFPLAHPNDGIAASLDKIGVACLLTQPVQPKKYNALFRYFIETGPGDHAMSIDCSVDKSELSDMVLELEVIEDGRSILKSSGTQI